MCLPSLVVTSDAPMCWVMPPRSPDATVVERIASSRLVLPWSTWPMTVTIGARATRSSSSLLEQDLLGRLGGRAAAVLLVGAGVAASASATSKPSSLATSDAVSRSMSWLMVAKIPLLISSRMMSAGLTTSSSASSLTVIVPGSSIAPRSSGSATVTAPGVKAPVRRWGLRGPRRPRVPLLLLATRSSLMVSVDGGAGDAAPARVVEVIEAVGSGREGGRDVRGDGWWSARARGPACGPPCPSRTRRGRGRRLDRAHGPSGRPRSYRPAPGRSGPGHAWAARCGTRRSSGSGVGRGGVGRV